MKRRVAIALPTRVGTPEIRAVLYQGSSPMVTLEDPEEGPESARGAFARLRPPEALSPLETAAWRAEVAAIAQAVRVLPSPRSQVVPVFSMRPDGKDVEGVYEEAVALAKEADDPELVELVERIWSEVT